MKLYETNIIVSIKLYAACNAFLARNICGTQILPQKFKRTVNNQRITIIGESACINCLRISLL